jgi:signal peptidase II
VQAARGASLTIEQPDTGVHAAAPARRLALLAAVAAAGLVVDVVTKLIVVAQLESEGHRKVELGPLILRVTRNPGAAFSFAEDKTWFFTAFALLVVGVVVYNARRVRDRGWAVALGLLLAGASGNLLDRAFRSPGPGRGAVVDFLDFQVWPSFNVADSCIVCGGVLAVLLSYLGREIDGTRHTDHDADDDVADGDATTGT